MAVSTIQLKKASMMFSAGHFTIYSAHVRERMHGHNYQVEASFTFSYGDIGLSFDCFFYENKIAELCQSLNFYFLLPDASPFLQLEQDKTHVHVTFDGQSMSLLKQDVKILPLSNISIEELSRWFVDNLSADRKTLEEHHIQAIKIKVYSLPEQSAEATWQYQPHHLNS